MTNNQSEKLFFLNGWIGVRLAERWLQTKGFSVKRSVPQRRGTEGAVSSGDIDLVARKASKTLYVEVKFWGAGTKPYTLIPSWLVEFMLDRKKLNTLFERHEDATEYLLVYRYPSEGTFKYNPTRKYKYIDRLVSHYKVPLSLIRQLSGQSYSKFTEEVLRFLVRKRLGKEVKFSLVYFQQILEELGQAQLDECRMSLKGELLNLFEGSYSDIIGRS